MKTKCQNIEFPELVVKIAFCFFLKLMVTTPKVHGCEAQTYLEAK